MKNQIKILVVDDEAIIRQSLKILLERNGHKVWPAESGEEALKLLAEHKFDLVITDFVMPGMRGDQLVAQIRQRLPTQAIVMATAFAEEYRISNQASARADAVLQKPFSIEQLREVVEQVLPHVNAE